jgi:hypothetical protein
MVSGWQLTVKIWPWARRIKGSDRAANRAELKDGMVKIVLARDRKSQT